MTLTGIALFKAVVFPITLALLLTVLTRRSANRWCMLAAFLSGGLGAFSLHSSLLRSLPSFQPSDQLQVTTAGQAWFSAFVEAAIPEEFSKGVWMLVFLVGWRQYTAGHGVLLGGLIGLGFALRENLAYGQIAPEWRVMPAVCHGAWGVIMGSLLQRAGTGPQWSFPRIVWGFIPTTLLHGLLDSSMFLVEAHESQTGLSPANPQSDAAASPLLLVEMAGTFIVALLSLIWSIRIVQALRRSLAGDPKGIQFVESEVA
ncbi:PrsW family glutamic-type intramembrane protease [Verrucomicrobiota bacterium sgz303538]